MALSSRPARRFEFLHYEDPFYRGLVRDLLRWQLPAPERHDGNPTASPPKAASRESGPVWLELALGACVEQKWDGKRQNG